MLLTYSELCMWSFRIVTCLLWAARDILLSCAHALRFLARLYSDCNVGSHSSLLHCLCAPTPSCRVSLIGWQSTSCLHCLDTTTYIAIPCCTTHCIEQNNYFLLYMYVCIYSADQNKRKTAQTLIIPCYLNSLPTDFEVLLMDKKLMGIHIVHFCTS